MDNIITMRSYSDRGVGETSQVAWLNKLQPKSDGVNKAHLNKHYIHRKNGEYWFGNKSVKYLVEQARRQGLIIAPPDHKD